MISFNSKVIIILFKADYPSTWISYNNIVTFHKIFYIFGESIDSTFSFVSSGVCPSEPCHMFFLSSIHKDFGAPYGPMPNGLLAAHGTLMLSSYAQRPALYK